MSFVLRELAIPGVFEITLPKYGDERGFFSETYNQEKFAEAGIDVHWVQDNHAFSAEEGVLRGLHYQLLPFAQDKLIRVTRGSVYDVVADIRKGSPTFGQWVGVEISAQKWNQLFVPNGMAHGYLTLEPNCEFLYKVSSKYAPEHDRAIRFNDPRFAIDWPLQGRELKLSDKDKSAPLLEDADIPDAWHN